MTTEEILKGQIEFCEEQVANSIKSSLRWQRRRLFWSTSQAGFQLLFACLDFYRGRYGNAILDCVMAELIAAFTWWCFTRPVNSYRQCRREWGELKRLGEKILHDWQGYKE